MNNENETTKKTPHLHIAGMHPADKGIELHGDRKTKKVYWLQNGSTHYFKDLSPENFNLLKASFLSNKPAYQFISEIHKDLESQVELYTYYMYGDLDGAADIVNGELSAPENFRDRLDCPSLLWNNKNITIDNYNLKAREIVIIDMMLQNIPDKAIWDALKLSESHFNTVKRNLLHSTNCSSSKELIIKSILQKVMLNS